MGQQVSLDNESVRHVWKSGRMRSCKTLVVKLKFLPLWLADLTADPGPSEKSISISEITVKNLVDYMRTLNSSYTGKRSIVISKRSTL